MVFLASRRVDICIWWPKVILKIWPQVRISNSNLGQIFILTFRGLLIYVSTRLEERNTMVFFSVSLCLLDKKLSAINIFLKNGHFLFKAHLTRAWRGGPKGPPVVFVYNPKMAANFAAPFSVPLPTSISGIPWKNWVLGHIRRSF